MSARPLRSCASHGCPNLVERGRCRSCHRKIERKYDAIRGSARERGYDATWQKVRRLYLREHANCERCMAEKRMVTADLVHHRDRDPRNNTAANLEALCYRHHEEEHAEDRQGAA